MMISLIAAMDKNRLIGKGGNELPWRLPADLKRFKSITLGKPIIMGRKTFESIGKPLPDRTNIVITRNEKYEAPGCVIARSPEEALRAARLLGEARPKGTAGDAPEIMIIGGAEIFTHFLPRARRMYLTLVEEEFSGNIYFPRWSPEEWRETSREPHEADEKNSYRYTFITMERG